MAIDHNEYIQTKEKNIKVHKKNRLKFLFDFRIDNKRYRRFFVSEAISSTPKDLLSSARVVLEKQKKMIRNGDVDVHINVSKLYDLYESKNKKTEWEDKKKRFFELYIKDDIGSIQVDKLRPFHIEDIIRKMEKKSYSPRTCRAILEVVNPLFKFAMKNNFMKDSPSKLITVEVPSQKKKVDDGLDSFRKLYKGIMNLYNDNPRYRALFLFAWMGRRKSEIFDLQWENINFDKNYYWILDTKSGEDQKFPLPPVIKEALLNIHSKNEGIVFKSRGKTGRLCSVDHQVQRLKKETGIEKLTLHYMRNILVTALSDESVEAVNLSGMLGHRDINTINKYLSNSTMKSGLIGLETIDNILDIEIIQEEI